MASRDFEIDKDIRRASTLPARVYSDPEYLELEKARVFARSWQWIGDSARVKAPMFLVMRRRIPEFGRGLQPNGNS
jgi:hypothetical protein